VAGPATPAKEFSIRAFVALDARAFPSLSSPANDARKARSPLADRSPPLNAVSGIFPPGRETIPRRFRAITAQILGYKTPKNIEHSLTIEVNQMLNPFGLSLYQ